MQLFNQRREWRECIQHARCKNLMRGRAGIAAFQPQRAEMCLTHLILLEAFSITQWEKEQDHCFLCGSSLNTRVQHASYFLLWFKSPHRRKSQIRKVSSACEGGGAMCYTCDIPITASGSLEWQPETEDQFQENWGNCFRSAIFNVFLLTAHGHLLWYLSQLLTFLVYAAKAAIRNNDLSIPFHLLTFP